MLHPQSPTAQDTQMKSDKLQLESTSATNHSLATSFNCLVLFSNKYDRSQRCPLFSLLATCHVSEAMFLMLYQSYLVTYVTKNDAINTWIPKLFSCKTEPNDYR